MNQSGDSLSRQNLVSIPLCVFNGERFLRAQVDSILGQSYPNLEVLAFDDCSTDGSAEILKQYTRKDSRISVIKNEINVGFRENFSRALASCRGEFVAPSDQDDIWLPTKIERLMGGIGAAAMIFSDSLLVDENGCSLHRRMSELVRMTDRHDPLELVFSNCVSGHAMLFRRKLLDVALPIPAAYFHDHWLAIVAAADAGLVHLPDVLIHYRQHHANVTDVLGSKAGGSSSRYRGYRLDRWKIQGERLQLVNEILKCADPDINELACRWNEHADAWFSPRLCQLIFRNRHRLYAIYPRSPVSLLQELKRAFFGLRLMRLLDPFAYGK